LAAKRLAEGFTVAAASGRCASCCRVTKLHSSLAVRQCSATPVSALQSNALSVIACRSPGDWLACVPVLTLPAPY